jgi:retron-type reverse transcriptase
METKLKRIAEVAKANPNEKFTSLAHLINSEMLTQCHREMKGKKAAGVDSVTKQEYEEHLSENLDELVARQ